MRYGGNGSILSAVVMVVALPTGAEAATINFGALQTMGTPVSTVNGDLRSFGATLSYGGLDFSTTNTISYGLSVWEATATNHPVGGTAATSLFEWAHTYQVSIERTGGGAFDLLGIDLANWGVYQSNFPSTFGVTFTGTRADNSTVTQTFNVANSGPDGASPILQSFLFSGFNDVVKVDVTQGWYAAGFGFQFNNLVVQTTDAAAVPEPATLLAVGMGLVGAAARRRRPSRPRRG